METKQELILVTRDKEGKIFAITSRSKEQGYDICMVSKASIDDVEALLNGAVDKLI